MNEKDNSNLGLSIDSIKKGVLGIGNESNSSEKTYSTN